MCHFVTSEDCLRQDFHLSSGQKQVNITRQDVGGEHTRDLSAGAGTDGRGPRFARWSAAHQETYQVLWHVDIVPLPETALFPCPMTLGVQATSDRRYEAEGRWRPEQDYCYFCYTLDGIGGFADRQGVHHLSAGEGFLIEIADPDTRYFYPGADERPWRFLAFNFRGLAARAMVRGLVGQYGSLYRLGLQSSVILRLLAFQTSPYTTIHPHTVDGTELVFELLLALAAAARAREAPNPAMGLLRRALELIDTELEHNMSVATLASLTGVNREYLSRAFHKGLGQSPQQVIREMKMRRASFLLKDSGVPIKQIADRLGYSDYTNFIRAFRQITGMTPHDFRLRGSIPLPQPFRRPAD